MPVQINAVEPLRKQAQPTTQIQRATNSDRALTQQIAMKMRAMIPHSPDRLGLVL